MSPRYEAGSIPAIMLAVGMAGWCCYRLSKVIRTFRRRTNERTCPSDTKFRRKVVIGMKVVRYATTAVSVLIGWAHVAAPE